MPLSELLFKKIDNSALIVFRVIFGLLLILESVGAILTGWVKRTLIEPEFTFSFIGFEWLQPLPGNGMYFYYLLMGLLGLMVMLGYKYRFAMIAFTILWAGSYFMQKASYNNHYYLLILISGIMALLPANRLYSIDAQKNPNIRQEFMLSWCKWIIVLQLFIVYTYASVAKMYPDWLDLTVAKNLMASKKDYFLIGELLQQRWLHYLLTYAGILFDLLIVPALLWKPTRKWAFIASIFFHLFNSFVFQIGIFPYLSLAFTLFFFEPKTIQRIFLKKKQFYDAESLSLPKNRKIFLLAASVYFMIQLALPIRHWFIKGDVLWTEEGHRLSWRMMLRSKHGLTNYRLIDKQTGEKTDVNLNNYLSPKQKRIATTKPDVIWQFAQHLKREYAKEGKDISVFVSGNLSINGKEYKPFIDSEVDLAAVEWDALRHSEWILPSE
ncbi:MAG: HTTM domain-containing protein [Flavobacteriaceae bacterium]|nr:MAG: HTTM domain-containing protein [Flavobacteriaceae bacterium]